MGIFFEVLNATFSSGNDHEIKNINFAIPKKGNIVCLLGPSGAGKTTIAKKIQQKYQSFKISVSHTTRKPRPNEIDGVDYYFISHEKFKKFISEGKFYEYAKIFENYYGTSKEIVDQMIKKNDMLIGKNRLI